MNAELSIPEVRAAIDELDRELVRLLARRQRLVERAGQLKRGQGVDAVRAPSRVEDVVQTRRSHAVDSGLDPDVAERIWRSMIAAFTDLELGVQAEAR